MSSGPRSVLAVGVAACAACCAPPILGVLGLTVGLAAVAWFVGGLLVAAVVLSIGLAVVSRRRCAAA